MAEFIGKGGLLRTSSFGGSVASARDARVSIIKLILKIRKYAKKRVKTLKTALNRPKIKKI
jgi:hypothetical protein